MTHANFYASLQKNSGYRSPYQASSQASPGQTDDPLLPKPQAHPSGRKSVLAKFSPRLNVPGFMHKTTSKLASKFIPTKLSAKKF